jgi:hypothetical protein
MRSRVYIAGPITKGVLADNIRQATEAAVRLLKAGYAPLCPHLTCYMGGSMPQVLPCGTVHDDWYQADLPWVQASDALLRLPGESKGADLEVACAEAAGIPVYTDEALLMKSIPAEHWSVVAPSREDALRRKDLEARALQHPIVRE